MAKLHTSMSLAHERTAMQRCVLLTPKRRFSASNRAPFENKPMRLVNTRRFAMMMVIPMCMVAAAVSAEDPPTTHDKAQTEHATPADSQQPGSDTWITTKVKADLLTTSNVPGMEIKVETVNGEVMLSGMVSSAAEKERAVATTRAIEGVERVDASALTVSASK